MVYEGNAVEGGPRDGQTVKDVLAELGDTFLGEGVSERFGGRFPLLIKLLDCADWLSVQVHPNDEQARELVGEGEFGKTEAWNFIAADPGAKILAGVKAGTSPEELATAIRSGKVLEVAEEKIGHSGRHRLYCGGHPARAGARNVSLRSPADQRHHLPGLRLGPARECRAQTAP